MNHTTYSEAALLDVVLDRDAKQPLFEQLVQILRRIILGGRLAAGSKLPSTRNFACELSVSRATIVTAYDQLTAEGYIESRRGSGVFVAGDLSDQTLQVEIPAIPVKKAAPALLAPRPFQQIVPDMRLFPHKQWAKMYQRIWSYPDQDLLADADPLGWWSLRQQIADHLRAWRGIVCQPEQVVITSGAGEAMQTIIDAILQSGQTVAREEPGYSLFSRILDRSRVTVQSVPVDDQGISVEALKQLQPQPTCAITTPSRQFPLGITMPLTRRLQLLDWANQDGRFVIEDDYDSEYRYVGQPLPALMSLARDGSVIYLGSFSKIFSKTLRLGYMVIPQNSLENVHQIMKTNGANASGLAQPVLAEFMKCGAFASHIRRMRRVYAARQRAFVALADEHLAGLVVFKASGGGMHLVGRLEKKLASKMTDIEICRRASKTGIVLMPLSENYMESSNRSNAPQGLIAGYAGFNEQELKEAVCKLAKALCD